MSEVEVSIFKTIGVLGKNEEKLIDAKKELIDLEAAYEVEVAKMQLKSKEEWKDLGISNAEGRKAYITLKLQDKIRGINAVKAEIVELELKIKMFKRVLEFQKEFHQTIEIEEVE